MKIDKTKIKENKEIMEKELFEGFEELKDKSVSFKFETQQGNKKQGTGTDYLIPIGNIKQHCVSKQKVREALSKLFFPLSKDNTKNEVIVTGLAYDNFFKGVEFMKIKIPVKGDSKAVNIPVIINDLESKAKDFHRVCMIKEKGFEEVGIPNGLGYEGVLFYKITDNSPQSHGYALPQDMHKSAYVDSGLPEDVMQELWEEDVKDHVELFYMKPREE